MDISTICEVTPFADLGPGKIVALLAADVKLFCLTIQPHTIDGPSIVCLWPGHPSLDGAKAGVFDWSVVGNRPAIVYPQAFVVPSTRLDDMMFTRRGSWPVSALVVENGRTVVVAATGYSSMGVTRCESYDVVTGAPVPNVHRSDSAVAFRSWEVRVPVEGGKTETLFRMGETQPGA